MDNIRAQAERIVDFARKSFGRLFFKRPVVLEEQQQQQEEQNLEHIITTPEVEEEEKSADIDNNDDDRDVETNADGLPPIKEKTMVDMLEPDSGSHPLQQTLKIIQDSMKSSQEQLKADLEDNSDVTNFIEESGSVDYNLEFVSFLNHNTPAGFAERFTQMMPYMVGCFFAWPSYWFYRGVLWHYRRGSEHIGIYIQRTFQRAKFIQIAIITAGLLASIKDDDTLDVHEVKSKRS